MIPSNFERAVMTLCCKDADTIPKVPGAGKFETVDGVRCQLMHNGIRVLAGGYHGDWMAHIIHGLKGHHEPQEERAFYEVLRYVRPGSTILELGAFWGYYSLWFLRDIPDARAVLVEPDPNNLRLGQRNFALNRLAGEFVHACVGERFLNSVDFVGESNQALLRIPQYSVDSLCESNKIEHIEVLHADTQGAELSVLKGAQNAIRSGCIRFVFVSTHHQLISGSATTHRDCLALLESYDAHILCEHDVYESYSGDGLIVASFDRADRLIPSIEISRNRNKHSYFPPDVHVARGQ